MLNYTLHKDIPVPLYYQLKLQILADIKEGRLHVGDMLPPECELCKEMGISRPTVRQAMGELVAEGHLTRCKGKGTFVSAPSVRPVDARESSVASLMRCASPPDSVVDDWPSLT